MPSLRARRNGCCRPSAALDGAQRRTLFAAGRYPRTGRKTWSDIGFPIPEKNNLARKRTLSWLWSAGVCMSERWLHLGGMFNGVDNHDLVPTTLLGAIQQFVGTRQKPRQRLARVMVYDTDTDGYQSVLAFNDD